MDSKIMSLISTTGFVSITPTNTNCLSLYLKFFLLHKQISYNNHYYERDNSSFFRIFWLS